MFQRAMPRAAARVAPAAAVMVFTISLLLAHAGVDVVARFTGFVIFLVTLPGLVVWRLATGRRRNLVEDVAAGFCVGTALQILAYLAGSAAGLQRWTWLWAVPVLVAACARRSWRTRWWRPVDQPLRPMTSALLAAACAVPLLVVFRHGPARFAPAYTDPNSSYADLSFHHALAASARYDVPLEAAWVDGEPMRYHYFFHQLLAATSWGTGIDLTHLVFTLMWLPLVLAGSLLVFVLADRLMPGSGWAGPLAVLLAAVGGTLQPYRDDALAADMTTSAAYLSPTQNLGVALGALLAVTAVDLLRGSQRRGTWAILLLLALAASGSKATILPLAACGFGLVLLARLAQRRRIDAVALTGGALTTLVLVGSVAVVFGGESSGLAVRPGQAFARMPPYPLLRSTTGMDVDPVAQLTTAAITLLAWTVATAGMLVLLRARDLWRDPAVVFLAGFAVAGFAAMLLTDQPGNSQMYFHRTAVPAIAVLSCLGLHRVVARVPDPARPVLVAASALLGLGGCAAARVLAARGDVEDGLGGLLVPWLTAGVALALVAAVVLACWRIAGRAGRAGPVLMAALLSAAMVGATLVPLLSVVSDTGAAGKIFARPGRGGATGPEAAAARWLRDHSRPGDLVATNAHCATRPRRDACDARHFWLAALSERHVLVEGWAYTNTINRMVANTGQSANLLPFWDQQRLRDNDAAFRNPSAAAVARLRDEYGVRWLYADLRTAAVPAGLERYATLHYRGVHARVYEIR